MSLKSKSTHPATREAHASPGIQRRPTLQESAVALGQSQSWGCEVVDFSVDERWHKCFFGNPTKQDMKDLNSFLKQDPERFIRLYHGTSANIPVLEEGLLATSATRRRSLASSSGYVYLSVYPAHAEQFGSMGAPGKETQVYAVVVPVRRLLADADQLRQRRAWGGEAFQDLGTSLADSLVHGHGARVKGAIDPRVITPLKAVQTALEEPETKPSGLRKRAGAR